jgi:hypothetical protein
VTRNKIAFAHGSADASGLSQSEFATNQRPGAWKSPPRLSRASAIRSSISAIDLTDVDDQALGEFSFTIGNAKDAFTFHLP